MKNLSKANDIIATNERIKYSRIKIQEMADYIALIDAKYPDETMLSNNKLFTWLRQSNLDLIAKEQDYINILINYKRRLLK